MPLTTMDASYQIINDFKLPADRPPKWTREKIEWGLSYKAKDTDRFIVTYPKCGTTWTQQMIFLILNDGKPQKDDAELFTVTPFLELRGSDAIEKLPSNGVIKSHLPFHLIPYNPKAKYLYVLRNPKDACVSDFHHAKKDGSIDNVDFHQYFKKWISGEMAYGDYFDHVLLWWKHKDDENVNVLIYEDMKKDQRKAITEIAKFLGYEQKLSDSLIQQIIQCSSVEFMRGELKFDLLVRKGVTGDWKNHFTKEENEIIDEIIKKRLTGTGLEVIWKDVMTL